MDCTRKKLAIEVMFKDKRNAAPEEIGEKRQFTFPL